MMTGNYKNLDGYLLASFSSFLPGVLATCALLSPLLSLAHPKIFGKQADCREGRRIQ